MPRTYQTRYVCAQRLVTEEMGRLVTLALQVATAAGEVVFLAGNRSNESDIAAYRSILEKLSSVNEECECIQETWRNRLEEGYLDARGARDVLQACCNVLQKRSKVCDILTAAILCSLRHTPNPE